MGRRYSQLSLEDRCEIARLHGTGSSIRQIAAALDRKPSTISRELRRNSGKKVGYKPSYAQEQAKARRWSGSRLAREPDLRRAVLSGLVAGHSPEQVAGRLRLEAGHHVICAESIYRFIYAQIRRTNDSRWRLYLPHAKSRRGYRGKPGGSPASFIKGRLSIALRPPAVARRKTAGHWEADLMLFAKAGQAILTLHERHSRLLVAARAKSKAAEPIADQLVSLLAGLPDQMRRTVTFDNGTEFAHHQRLHSLNIKTFFCDPHAPWQKGGIENANGRMRRLLPRNTDLASVSSRRFRDLLAIYNHTPRKCLAFKTPAEVFSKQLLHFKCESTPRLSSG